MLVIGLLSFIAAQGCIVWNSASANASPQHVEGIPQSHIFHYKQKPIVIGHRGNPIYYQENTFQGFKSLLRNGADGFEVDVFLTKDNKLVCFHDKNAKRLTGVDKNIADMTSAEIKKLRYKKTIKYGRRIYRYGRRRKVVFLEDLLRWASNTDLLVYIEMKPSDVILKDRLALQKSMETGQAVAQLINEYNMIDRVVLNTYDIQKVIAAKKVQNNLVIGTAYSGEFWSQPAPVYNVIKQQLKRLIPKTGAYLDKINSMDKTFVTHLFKNGIVEKSIGASLTDIELIMFDNCTYGSSYTMKMLRQNLSAYFVIGAYTIYSMKEDDSIHRSMDWKVERIIREGIDFMITDNVTKLLQKIQQCKPISHQYYGYKNEKKQAHADTHIDPLNEKEAIQEDMATEIRSMPIHNIS